jgi:hypothetical protein
MLKVKIKVSLDLIQLHGVKALEVWRYGCTHWELGGGE